MQSNGFYVPFATKNRRKEERKLALLLRNYASLTTRFSSPINWTTAFTEAMLIRDYYQSFSLCDECFRRLKHLGNYASILEPWRKLGHSLENVKYTTVSSIASFVPFQENAESERWMAEGRTNGTIDGKIIVSNL